jgi:hypothetical protein
VQFESRPVDVEFVHLIHDLQSTEIVGHKYRGYTLLTEDGRKLRNIKVSMSWHVLCLFVSDTTINFKKEYKTQSAALLMIGCENVYYRSYPCTVIPGYFEIKGTKKSFMNYEEPL